MARSRGKHECITVSDRGLDNALRCATADPNSHKRRRSETRGASRTSSPKDCTNATILIGTILIVVLWALGY